MTDQTDTERRVYVPEFPEGPQPTDHPFIRPGQVRADLPAPDACMRCGQPEAEHQPGRPLTYDDAETVYQTRLNDARERYAELSDQDLSARATAILRERGELDPENPGHQLLASREPLIAAEHLEHMAIGEILARYYRHPSMLDSAAKAGASWEQIGAARGTSADQARQDYRDWADSQHGLLGWTDGKIGMSDVDYAEAMQRIAESAAAKPEAAE